LHIKGSCPQKSDSLARQKSEPKGSPGVYNGTTHMLATTKNYVVCHRRPRTGR